MNKIVPAFIDYQYLEIGNYILGEGDDKPSRPGINTRASFGIHLRHDLNDEGYPAIASKHLALDVMAKELHWFLNGSSDNNILTEQGCKIWNQWAAEDGDLGPIYGVQWRDREEVIRLDKRDPKTATIYNNMLNSDDTRGLYSVEETNGSIFFYRKVDQIAAALDSLRNNPNDRRIIVDAWNTAVLPIPGIDPTLQASYGRQALAPCHVLFQFNSRPSTLGPVRSFYNVQNVGEYVSVNNVMTTMTLEDAYDEQKFMQYVEQHDMDKVRLGNKQLDILMFQRSCDWPVGVPFNIASYALLCGYVAAATGHDVGIFNLFGGDVHVYENQIDLFDQQLDVLDNDMPEDTQSPVLVVYNVPCDLRNMSSDNFRVFKHKQGPVIKYPVAK